MPHTHDPRPRSRCSRCRTHRAYVWHALRSSRLRADSSAIFRQPTATESLFGSSMFSALPPKDGARARIRQRSTVDATRASTALSRLASLGSESRCFRPVRMGSLLHLLCACNPCATRICAVTRRRSTCERADYEADVSDSGIGSRLVDASCIGCHLLGARTRDLHDRGSSCRDPDRMDPIIGRCAFDRQTESG
jgi:hypothetical protein